MATVVANEAHLEDGYDWFDLLSVDSLHDDLCQGEV